MFHGSQKETVQVNQVTLQADLRYSMTVVISTPNPVYREKESRT